jgi:hypothetical protein
MDGLKARCVVCGATLTSLSSERQFHPAPPPTAIDAPDAVFARAAKLTRQIDTAYIALGRELYMIFHRKLYLAKGHDSFRDYLECDLGVSGDRGERVKRIWTKFVRELNLKPEQLTGVGYTRALALLPIVTSDNAESWLEKARSMQWRDLHIEIAKAKSPPAAVVDAYEAAGADVDRVTPTITKTPTRPLKFNLRESQSSIWQVAYDEVRRAKATEVSLGECLAHICTEFLASRATKEMKPHARLRFYLRMFEEVFGGKFVWLRNPEAADVLLEAMENRPDLYEHVPVAEKMKETKHVEGHPDDGDSADGCKDGDEGEEGEAG